MLLSVFGPGTKSNIQITDFKIIGIRKKWQFDNPLQEVKYNNTQFLALNAEKTTLCSLPVLSFASEYTLTKPASLFLVTWRISCGWHSPCSSVVHFQKRRKHLYHLFLCCYVQLKPTQPEKASKLKLSCFCLWSLLPSLSFPCSVAALFLSYKENNQHPWLPFFLQLQLFSFCEQLLTLTLYLHSFCSHVSAMQFICFM